MCAAIVVRVDLMVEVDKVALVESMLWMRLRR